MTDETADGGAEQPAAFPLVAAAALRLWLLSALILAIATVAAWSTRGPAPEGRVDLPPMAGTAAAPAR